MEVNRRRVSAEEWRAEPRVDGMRPVFVEMLQEAVGPRDRVLDVCTGAGRVALHLADRASVVVGVDVAENRLRKARRRAAERGLENVHFVRGDAEEAEYDAFLSGGDAVTSRMCMSRAIVERAGRYLSPGDAFVFAAHHVDHWRETGRGSGYAFGEGEMLRMLSDSGMEPVRLVLDVAEVEYRSLDEVERDVGERTVERWRRDSRWQGLEESFDRGENHLTRSVLLGLARKGIG